MRKKGLIGWLAAAFFGGVFAALFLFILVYSFKYHITMLMSDFYFWSKEYDIPLALFSIDVKEDSFVVAANKLYYKDVLGEEYEELNDEISRTIESWFPKTAKTDYTRKFILTFGNEVFDYKEEFEGCHCHVLEKDLTGQITKSYCTDDCGSKATEPPFNKKVCEYDSQCIPSEMAVKLNDYGSYPLPLVFNGTDFITELKWSSNVVWWIE